MTFATIKERTHRESFPPYLNFQASTAQPSDRVAVLPFIPLEGMARVTRDDLGEATTRILDQGPLSPEWNNSKKLSGNQSWTLDRRGRGYVPNIQPALRL